MRKERRIINTNIRLNLCDEQDRKAWEYLQTMDRQKYKSYTKAVVAALNDYFAREYRNKEDNRESSGSDGIFRRENPGDVHDCQFLCF